MIQLKSCFPDFLEKVSGHKKFFKIKWRPKMKSRQEIFFEDIEPIISEIISKLSPQISPQFSEEIRKSIQSTLWNNTLSFEKTFSIDSSLSEDDFERAFEHLSERTSKLFFEEVAQDPGKYLQEIKLGNEEGQTIFLSRLRALKLKA
jgi:hypothetical protein